jgi:hypothetical protein
MKGNGSIALIGNSPDQFLLLGSSQKPCGASEILVGAWDGLTRRLAGDWSTAASVIARDREGFREIKR